MRPRATIDEDATASLKQSFDVSAEPKKLLRQQALSTLPPFRVVPTAPPTVLTRWKWDVLALVATLQGKQSWRARYHALEDELRISLHRRTELLAEMGKGYIELPAAQLLTSWQPELVTIDEATQQLELARDALVAEAEAHATEFETSCGLLLTDLTAHEQSLAECNQHVMALERELSTVRRQSGAAAYTRLAELNVAIATAERERTMLQKSLAELREDEANRRERAAERADAQASSLRVLDGEAKELGRRRRRLLASIGEQAARTAPPDELVAIEREIERHETALMAARLRTLPAPPGAWVRLGVALGLVALAAFVCLRFV